MCEHQVVPKLKLIFSKSLGSRSGEKERLKSFWEFVRASQACKSEENVAPVPNLESKAADASVITEGVLLTDYEKYQTLFELMVSKGLDRDALAISPSKYRIKPQVCLCTEICCTCFDYSPFLHNLKLHTFKRQMLREYKKLYPLETVEQVKTIHIDEDAATTLTDKSGTVFDEFHRRGGGVDDDDSSCSGGGTIVTEAKTISKAPSVDKDKSARPKSKAVFRKYDVPAYESKLNSVHKRPRKFDPNLYKKILSQQVLEQSKYGTMTK